MKKGKKKKTCTVWWWCCSKILNGVDDSDGTLIAVMWYIDERSDVRVVVQ